MKIRKGDNIVVLSWKNKWSNGKVLKVLQKTNRVIVEWVNVVKRHMKKMWTTPWAIIEKENPIDASNVALVCPFTSKKTRIGYVIVKEWKNTKKFRYSKAALKEKGGEAKDYIIK